MTTKEHDKISLIFRRDNERKENIKKQKDLKELNTAHNEKIDYFNEEFSIKLSEIEKLLHACSTIPVCNLAEQFNIIFKDLSLLQKYVADSNLFLRSYDIKKFNDVIHEFTEKAKDLEDTLLPKKKFGFKNKSRLANNTKESKSGIDITDNPLKLQLNDSNSVESSNRSNEHSLSKEADIHKNNIDLSKSGIDVTNKPHKLQLDDFNSVGFSNRSNEDLFLKETDIHNKNIDIHDVSNCTIRILGSPSTLHMHALKNCTVLCGPVSTSIFASNCEDCTFVIACQQLRLHSSKKLNIYLHVTSRAIIEDCSIIHVAPYNLKYEKLQDHFNQSGLDISLNNWQCVDDFNWLKAGEQSPNWNIIEESNRMEWIV